MTSSYAIMFYTGPFATSREENVWECSWPTVLLVAIIYSLSFT